MAIAASDAQYADSGGLSIALITRSASLKMGINSSTPSIFRSIVRTEQSLFNSLILFLSSSVFNLPIDFSE